MSKVIIYSTQNCPYCVMAKKFMQTHGVSFTEVDITTDEETWNRLVQETGGWRTVPMIFVDDKFIGGHVEVQKYFSEAKKEGNEKI